jgi:hypothetical protein
MKFTAVRRSARLAALRTDYAISVTFGRTKEILDDLGRGEIPEGPVSPLSLRLCGLSAKQDAKCELAFLSPSITFCFQNNG